MLAQGARIEKLQAIKDRLKTYTDNRDEGLAKQVYRVFIEKLAEAYYNLDILPQPNAVKLFDSLRERNILTILNTGYNRQTVETVIYTLTRAGFNIDDEEKYL